MKKYFILLVGSPGMGKAYLTNKLRERFPDMYAITFDEIKEYYAEFTGFSNLEERAEQEGTKVYPFYHKALDLHMEAGKRAIVFGYSLNDKQKTRLQELAERYGYQVITTHLTADFEALWQRWCKHDREPDRHLSYIMDHYHYGDTLEDRSERTNHITKEVFKKIITGQKYDEFQLGTLYEFDVIDHTQVDYIPLLDKLEKEINDNK